MAATLTEKMLGDLMMGISKIQLVPPIKAAITNATFADADEIYTTRDSLSITQSAPSKTEIKVDQFDTAIAVAYEPGDFTITGQIPSVAAPLLNYFFDSVKGAVTHTLPGFEATTLNSDTKITHAAMLITSQSGKTKVCFTNTEFVANFAWDNTSTNLMRIEFTGTVKANPYDVGDKPIGSIIVFNAAEEETPTGI